MGRRESVLHGTPFKNSPEARRKHRATAKPLKRGGTEEAEKSKIYRDNRGLITRQRSFRRMELSKVHASIVVDANRVPARVSLKNTLKFLHHRRVNRIVL